MSTSGREDSGRYGIVLGSDVVLEMGPQALPGTSARYDAVSDLSDAHSIVDESVVLSTAGSSERALLALVDGRRTVQELVRLSGMTDLVVRRHLRGLCARGVLVPVPSSLPAPLAALTEDVSDSAVPRRNTSRGSGSNPTEGLSKALIDYLDSGKTADVQASASDGITARAPASVDEKFAPAPATTPSSPQPSSQQPSSPQSSSPTVVVVGSAADRRGEAPSAYGAVPVAALAGGEPDTEPVSQPRFKSPPSGVVAGEWPPRRANTPSGLKPAITAFWSPSPSSAESATPPSSGSMIVGSPQAGASPFLSTQSGSPSVSWSKASEANVRPIRPLPPAQGTIVVTGSPSTPSAPSSAEPTPGSGLDAVPTPVAPGGSRSRSAPIPFRLGEYEVATRIAQGGMGSIYVCRRAGAPGPQRLFTLKVVRQHSKQVAQVVQSFRREARVGTLLSHPNLQTVVHVGTYHEQPFLILDYLEGIGLADLMANQKSLPPAIVVSILLDVLRGLKAAHDLVDDQGARLGLVHGDVSPQNILVGVDGNARLTDFGSARFAADARAPEAAPVLMGKPAFMSPEQLCADPVDARTDLFSLGVVMWTALTGQSLFAADSYDQIVMNIFRKKIPPPSELGAPACFDEIAAGVLSRAPDGRYQSADEMASALTRAAKSEGIVGSPYDVGQWVRREFAETLAERRRRVQVVFGGPAAGATPVPVPVVASASAPALAAEAAAAPSAAAGEKPGAVSADGFPRLAARTIQLPMARRSTPRLATLAGLVQPGVERSRWRVVFLAAVVTFPFALALAYAASNPLVTKIRARMRPPAAVGVVDDRQPHGGDAVPRGVAAVPAAPTRVRPGAPEEPTGSVTLGPGMLLKPGGGATRVEPSVPAEPSGATRVEPGPPAEPGGSARVVGPGASGEPQGGAATAGTDTSEESGALAPSRRASGSPSAVASPSASKVSTVQLPARDTPNTDLR